MISNNMGLDGIVGLVFLVAALVLAAGLALSGNDLLNPVQTHPESQIAEKTPPQIRAPEPKTQQEINLARKKLVRYATIAVLALAFLIACGITIKAAFVGTKRSIFPRKKP